MGVPHPSIVCSGEAFRLWWNSSPFELALERARRRHRFFVTGYVIMPEQRNQRRRRTFSAVLHLFVQASEFELPMPEPTCAGERREIRYTTYQTVYEKIEMLKADETCSDPQYLPDATHRANIRCLPRVNIKANHRVPYGSPAFEIKAVVNLDERNAAIDLLCLERAEGAPTGV